MYLKESGCAATVAAFMAEPTTSAEVREDEASAGLLEKKWTSIIRLQKKVRFTSTSFYSLLCCALHNFMALTHT